MLMVLLERLFEFGLARGRRECHPGKPRQRLIRDHQRRILEGGLLRSASGVIDAEDPGLR
jgi:hypothetical protein